MMGDVKNDDDATHYQQDIGSVMPPISWLFAYQLDIYTMVLSISWIFARWFPLSVGYLHGGSPYYLGVCTMPPFVLTEVVLPVSWILELWHPLPSVPSINDYLHYDASTIWIFALWCPHQLDICSGAPISWIFALWCPLPGEYFTLMPPISWIFYTDGPSLVGYFTVMPHISWIFYTVVPPFNWIFGVGPMWQQL